MWGSPMFRFLIPFFLLIACFCRLDRIFYKQNDSFCRSHILADWSSLPSYPSPLSASTSEILSQTFSYLDKGNEYFVFLSHDKHWVIKFPRVPRHKDMTRTLNTLHICSTLLAEETAIEYAHLERTRTYLNVKLIDRFGHPHQIQIDHIPFIIQKAGQPFFEEFHTEHDPRALIRDAVAVYRSIQSKGFADRDPIFHKNFGISEGRPFIMDIGKIYEATSDDSLEKMTVSLRDEIALHCPHLLSYYKKTLH